MLPPLFFRRLHLCVLGSWRDAFFSVPPCLRGAFPALLLAIAATTAFAAPPIAAVTFAPEGRSVIVGSQAGIEELSWPELTSLRTLATELIHLSDLAFSPDGRTLAAGGGAPAERGEVELFRWPAGERVARLECHADLVQRVAWRPDGAAFATPGADRQVLLHPFDGTACGEPMVLAGHSRGVLAACWLPSGDVLVTAGVDQTLRVWDAASGTQRRSLDNHTGAVVDVATRPGGDGPPLVASAGADRTLRFWQPSIGRLVRFARLPADPLAICWSGDGRLVAVACSDGRVLLVDAATAKVAGDLAALDGWAYAIAAAPAGDALLVGGADGRLVRCELPDGGED